MESSGPSNEKKRRWRRHFLATIMLSLLWFVADNVGQAVHTMVTDTGAITTPWGPVYFSEEPSQWLQNHEQCHYDRLQEIGALAFYADYIFGGACEEELRCGADLKHTACSQYGFSRVPEATVSNATPWWLSFTFK